MSGNRIAGVVNLYMDTGFGLILFCHLQQLILNLHLGIENRDAIAGRRSLVITTRGSAARKQTDSHSKHCQKSQYSSDTLLQNVTSFLLFPPLGNAKQYIFDVNAEMVRYLSSDSGKTNIPSAERFIHKQS